MSFSSSRPRDFSPGRLLALAALLATFDLGLPSTAHALGDTFFDALDAYDSVRWQKSDGWANGTPGMRSTSRSWARTRRSSRPTTSLMESAATRR